MSPDGALTWFRRAHPEIRTLLVSPSVAGQRSSRSDLSPRPWDRVPGVRDAVAKSLGSNNPANTVKATMLALSRLRSPDEVRERRRAVSPEASVGG